MFFFLRLLSQLMLFSCESDKLKRTDQTSQQSAASVIGRPLTDVSTPRLLDTLSPYPKPFIRVSPTPGRRRSQKDAIFFLQATSRAPILHP
jgi:hypothetical protein